MKITIITGPNGEIVGTMRQAQPAAGEPEGPVQQLVADPRQKAQEIELPDEIAKLESADEFHKAVKEHLGKRKK